MYVCGESCKPIVYCSCIFIIVSNICGQEAVASLWGRSNVEL